MSAIKFGELEHKFSQKFGDIDHKFSQVEQKFIEFELRIVVKMVLIVVTTTSIAVAILGWLIKLK